MFFSNFFKKINIIKYKWILFNSLKNGDLVWSKMPFSKKDLNKIEKAHQIRPYLIVHKDFFHIYAYPSSSKPWHSLNNYQEYHINKLRYKQKKDSWINLSEIYKIPFYNLQSKYISLNELDQNNIEKRLKIQYNRNNKKYYSLCINIFIFEGDVIIINNQLYYVYCSDITSIYCLSLLKKLLNSNKKLTKIIINNKTYYANLKEKHIFKKNSNMNIINIAYPNEVENILNLKNNYKKIKTNKKLYKSFYESGTIFQVGNNKIVYLFELNSIYYGIDLLMYKINMKIMPIYNIEKRQILGFLPSEKFFNIIEFLYLHKTQPFKEISNLYYSIRKLLYN